MKITFENWARSDSNQRGYAQSGLSHLKYSFIIINYSFIIIYFPPLISINQGSPNSGPWLTSGPWAIYHRTMETVGKRMCIPTCASSGWVRAYALHLGEQLVHVHITGANGAVPVHAARSHRTIPPPKLVCKARKIGDSGINIPPHSVPTKI